MWNFLNNKLNNEITKKDIEKQARSIFKDFIKIKKQTNKIFTKIIGNDCFLWIDSFLSSGNIIPEIAYKLLKYDNEILKNENFFVTCVFKTGVEKTLKQKVSYQEFQTVFKILAYASEAKYQKIGLSAETKILKNFKINPMLLPEGVRSKIFALDEFILATDLILSKAKNIKNLNDGFESYNDYYKYVYEEVKKIVNELEKSDLYNHQPEDRMTVLLISAKLQMPMTDIMYKGASDESTNSLPTEVIKKIQEKIVDVMYFGKEPDETIFE